MAKKETKISLRQTFTNALSERDVKIEDCKVLAFQFDYETRVEMFHYDLMARKYDYYLFDCSGKTAYLIIPKEADESIFVNVAVECKGKQIKPFFLQ